MSYIKVAVAIFDGSQVKQMLGFIIVTDLYKQKEKREKCRSQKMKENRSQKNYMVKIIQLWYLKKTTLAFKKQSTTTQWDNITVYSSHSKQRKKH